MKRIALIVAAAAALLCSVDAGARGGIIGGFTSSNLKISNFDPKSVSLYHVGLTYQVKLIGGFSLQPSILYQVKGATLSDYQSGASIKGSIDTKVSYLEVPVSIQWGPDLIVARPYIFLEPFIGYALNVKDNSNLTNNVLTDEGRKQLTDNMVKRLEYGLGLGAGVELIKHLQVSIQYFWNFGSLADENAKVNGNEVLQNYTTAYKNVFNNSFNGVKISAAIFF